MKYKITPTLLNSFMYMDFSRTSLINKLRYKELTPQEREDVQANLTRIDNDFLAQLNRTFTLTTVAGARGNIFEDLVLRRTLNESWDTLEPIILKEFKDFDVDKLKQCVDNIASIVHGGEWQVKVTKSIFDPHSGCEYYLTGKMDVLNRNIPQIYDIKYTSALRNQAKFENSVQHRLYMICTDIAKFTYLISDGEAWKQEEYYHNKKWDQQYLLTIINNLIQHTRTNQTMEEAFDKHWRI